MTDPYDTELPEEEEEDEMIVVRELTGDAPAHWAGGRHWVVEYHPPAFYFPLGAAYLRWEAGACHLDGILIAEGYGQGPIKAALYRACFERWPQVGVPDRPRVPPHLRTDSDSQIL